MGSYHYRCLVSGISLRFADCVCVFIQRVGETWRPASLPMRGPFNSYGTIRDGERSFEWHARQVVKTFESGVDDKRIVLDGDAKWQWKQSKETGLDRILETIERTGTGHAAVRFRDAPLSHTLFQAPVWDAICTHASASGSLDALAPFGRWWYEDLARFPRDEVQSWIRGGLGEIAQVDAWMASHAIAWAPPRVFSEPGEQHDARDILESVRDARKRFAGTELAPAIEAAAEKIEDFGWDPPSGWVTKIDVSWYAIAIGASRYACTSVDDILPRITELDGPEDLLGKAVELLVVDRGDVIARIDLRQFLRIRAGQRSAKLDDVATCEDLLTDPGAECVVELDSIELPELRPPIASEKALLIVPLPEPAWMTKEEKYDTVIEFDLP